MSKLIHWKSIRFMVNWGIYRDLQIMRIGYTDWQKLKKFPKALSTWPFHILFWCLIRISLQMRNCTHFRCWTSTITILVWSCWLASWRMGSAPRLWEDCQTDQTPSFSAESMVRRSLGTWLASSASWSASHSSSCPVSDAVMYTRMFRWSTLWHLWWSSRQVFPFEIR